MTFCSFHLYLTASEIIPHFQFGRFDRVLGVSDVTIGEEGAVVINKIREHEGNFGFNASTLEYGDLVDSGVIDPTKVVKSTIQNAASVASLLLTTEALITEADEDDDENE